MAEAMGRIDRHTTLEEVQAWPLPDSPKEKGIAGILGVADNDDALWMDGAVKTGVDLSQVVLWNYANSREVLDRKIPIPAILHQRLSVDWADQENRPPLPRTSGVAMGIS
ncbi:MAG: hypothetical protein KJ069_30395 [Anaerolineae bacterium]|nr:hypothetical protein [Anaerolineae bacterium]